MQSQRLLLADNDEIYLELTKEFLEESGFQVLTAISPGKAWSLLTACDFDLAIIDVRLLNNRDGFDMSGIDLAERLRDNFDLPTIIISVFDSVEYVLRSLRPRFLGTARAVDFVLKIEGYDRLLSAIVGALDSNQITKTESGLSGIDPNLLQKSQIILRTCDYFQSHQALVNLFVDTRINQWQHRINEEKNVDLRIQSLIRFLHNQYNDSNENGLRLFLSVLQDRYDVYDRYWHEIDSLLNEIV